MIELLERIGVGVGVGFITAPIPMILLDFLIPEDWTPSFEHVFVRWLIFCAVVTLLFYHPETVD